MNPDVNKFLTTVVLVSFIVTIVLAVGSYLAYKLRERARSPVLERTGTAPTYFERYHPPVAGDPASGGHGIAG